MIISDISVQRPVLVSVVFIAFAVFGLVSLRLLPIDLFPEIEPPVMSVITAYPGASAEEVEEKVTEIMEEHLGAVSELEDITSTSKENVSVVTLQFAFDTDLIEAANEVRQNLEFAKLTLPKDVDPPILFQFDTSKLPVVMLGVTSDRGDVLDYRERIEDEILDPLKRVPGVGSVVIWSAPPEQVHVEVDRARMAAYGMTIGQIAQVIGAENFSLPAGHLDVGPQEFSVRMPAEFQTLEELEGVAISRSGDGVVRLGDVAAVSMGHQEVREVSRVGGADAIVGGVQKKAGGNTVEISTRVQAKIAELEKDLPAHLHVVPILDTSLFIRRMISSLGQTLAIAATLIVVVVFVFLGRVRASFVVALALPASLVIVFAAMQGAGYSINAISMMALCLAIGMVVDNAIVVLENISRHITEGKTPMEAARVGASEVGGAVLASTLTTVSVFLPLVFVGGLVGIMFGELAFVISVTIGASLVVALTLTPSFSARLLQGGEPGAFARTIDRSMALLERIYGRVLRGALRHRLLTIVGAVAIVVGTVRLIAAVGTDFMPQQNSGEVRVIAELPIGTSVDETARVGEQLVAELERQPEVVVAQFRAGTSSLAFSTAMGGKEGSHIVQVTARLKPSEERERTDGQVADHMRAFGKSIPEIAHFTVQAGSSVSSILRGMGKPVTIELAGSDHEALGQAARDVEELLRSVPGVVDVSADLLETRPEIRFILDRERASRLGVPAAQAGVALRAALYGQETTKYRGGGEDADVVVRMRDDDRRTAADLARVEVPSMLGGTVRLGDIGRLVEEASPIEIRRKNKQRILTVGANVQGRALGDVAADTERRLSETTLPRGVTFRFGGDVEEQRETFEGVVVALVLGALMVYLVMAGQFESFKDPFVIIFAIPFSITGAFLFLLLTNTTLSLPAFLGLVVLLGVVVNNAIVLVDYVNLLRRDEELPLLEALQVAGERRLRPVLMTTVTTVFGMIPLAMARGEGSELWYPLGRAALGGMIFSTAVTLVLVPVLYALMHRKALRTPPRTPSLDEEGGDE